MKNHEFAELVNDLRDVPNVQSKRAIIVRILTGAGIKPEGHEIAPPELEQQGGWISCSEQMPPDSKAVLTWDGVFEKINHTMYGHWQCWQPGKITHWQLLPSPPQPKTDTTPQIDNDGWIEWGGGECPVPENTEIDFICRDGEQGRNYEAREIGWFHDGAGDDIIAYRVIENDGRGEEC